MERLGWLRFESTFLLGGRRVLQFRVTKYNPAFRNAEGAYTRDEWTSSSDIGRTIDGSLLTEAEYKRTEDAYVRAATEFLRESGITSLFVAGVENSAGDNSVPTEGHQLNLSQIGETIRRLLREDFWCRLEDRNSFVHIGYEYYMYVAVPQTCPRAETLAQRLGLFVEQFESPYRT
jgi:hypothetical protein